MEHVFPTSFHFRDLIIFRTCVHLFKPVWCISMTSCLLEGVVTYDGTGTPVCQKRLTQGTLWYNGASCRKWHKCSFKSTSPIVLCPHSHYNQPLTVHTAVSVCYKRKSCKTALTSAKKKNKKCSRDAVGENKHWTRVNALSQSQ